MLLVGTVLLLKLFVCVLLGTAYTFGLTANGMITMEAWKSYIEAVLVPQIVAFRVINAMPQTEWIVLTMDGAGTVHCTHPSVLKILIENHIHAYKFLAHTSHFRQPLDVAYNARVQTLFRAQFAGFVNSVGAAYSSFHLPRLMHKIMAEVAEKHVR